MFVAMIVVTVLLAALMIYAAVRKLTHQPEVVESYRLAGVPEERLNLLAAVLLAGAAGLLAGLVWAPLGVAAATATLLYFCVALGFHARNHDLAHAGTPLVMVVLAGAATVLRLLT